MLLVTDTDGPVEALARDRWASLAAGARVAASTSGVVTRDGRRPASLRDRRGVARPTPGDAVDVLSSAPRRRGRRHGSDAHRRAAGHAHRHDLPATASTSAVAAHPGRDGRTRATTPARRVERDYAYNDRVDLRGFEWRPRSLPGRGALPGRPITARDRDARAGRTAVTGGGRGPRAVSRSTRTRRAGCSNSQPHGIGRVAALDGLVRVEQPRSQRRVRRARTCGLAPSSTSRRSPRTSRRSTTSTCTRSSMSRGGRRRDPEPLRHGAGASAPPTIRRPGRAPSRAGLDADVRRRRRAGRRRRRPAHRLAAARDASPGLLVSEPLGDGEHGRPTST